MTYIIKAGLQALTRHSTGRGEIWGCFRPHHVLAAFRVWYRPAKAAPVNSSLYAEEGRIMAFDQKLRTTVLLWCDRHCCLCKKACGVNIEVHHIIPEASGGSNDIDNALPLCFNCHSEVSRYNTEQPMGTKYKPEELKARREQVYEEFTRHLVPPVHYEITNYLSPNQKREFPDVGFNLTHFGDSLPVRVHIAERGTFVQKVLGGR